MNARHAFAVHRLQRPARRRGFAALTIVMVLFFVMALVAAYTNRNLIFEQRISTNSYRANRALEAAEAGVEWTLALLNGGRIDANCTPSIDPLNIDFRRRYHIDAPPGANGEGGYDVVWGNVADNRVYPACINREGVLSCVCPTLGAAVPGFGGVGDGLGSAFRVEFLRPGNAVRPGAIEFAARGCASVGDGGSACTAQTQDILPTVDGLSGALTTVGLVRALPLPPIAALTTGGAVNAPAGTLAVSVLSVDDGGFGLTVYAGGAVSPGALAAGADALLERENEAPLQALAVAPNELWFRSMFGQDRATFQRQPAVVRVDCAAGCTRANLNNVLAGYPRNPIWVDGNLDLDSVAPAPAIGSAAEPVMLIVTGQLTVSANVQITGFVHANSINWAAAAGGATVSGAMVSATTFTAQGVATLAYNWQVLDTIRLHYGSFVRAPGSWNLIFR